MKSHSNTAEIPEQSDPRIELPAVDSVELKAMPDLRLIDIAEAIEEDNSHDSEENLIERRHHTAALNLVHLATEAEPDLRFMALDELDEYFQSKSPELGFDFASKEMAHSEENSEKLSQAAVPEMSVTPSIEVEDPERTDSIDNEASAAAAIASTTLVEIEWEQEDEITDIISETDRALSNEQREVSESTLPDLSTSESTQSDVSASECGRPETNECPFPALPKETEHGSDALESTDPLIAIDDSTELEETVLLSRNLSPALGTAEASKKHPRSPNHDAHSKDGVPSIVVHQHELKHLMSVSSLLMLCVLLPYFAPMLEQYRPWNPGDPVPLFRLLNSSSSVVESNDGTLISAVEHTPDEVIYVSEEAAVLASTETVELPVVPVESTSVAQQPETYVFVGPPKPAVVPAHTRILSAIPARPPALPAELFVPEGSLDSYFGQLAALESGGDDVVRALVWGDSTIANDGIIRDVRQRLQQKFGDAGPGFLAVQVDRRWAMRRDIVRKPKGNWKTKTIVFGGADARRYGLAGTVSVGASGSTSLLSGPKVNGARQPIRRAQLFYQKRAGGGELVLSTETKSHRIVTVAPETSDGYYEYVDASGPPSLKLAAENGSVAVYGVALENGQPGVTWETFGVAGSSIASMQKQDATHMSGQIQARQPQLLVYWTGGNELGYPSLRSRTGKSYKRIYRKVIRSLRAGAPSASCLLIGPLDQAERVNGQVVSKQNLDKIIRFQQEVAAEESCAYWNARAAMGGRDSYATWLYHAPVLASSDMHHLTTRGRHLIGDTLADVLLHHYGKWQDGRSSTGASP